MKLKAFVFTILFTFSAVLYAQEIGEKVYKEILVEGKKETHWLIYKEYFEYDVSGNLLIKKDGIFKIKDFVFNITSISDY